MIYCYDLDGGSAPTCRQRRDAKQADLHRACPLVKYTGAGCYPAAAPCRTVIVRSPFGHTMECAVIEGWVYRLSRQDPGPLLTTPDPGVHRGCYGPVARAYAEAGGQLWAWSGVCSTGHACAYGPGVVVCAESDLIEVSE